jgi:hypothetical protein
VSKLGIYKGDDLQKFKNLKNASKIVVGFIATFMTTIVGGMLPPLLFTFMSPDYIEAFNIQSTGNLYMSPTIIRYIFGVFLALFVVENIVVFKMYGIERDPFNTVRNIFMIATGAFITTLVAKYVSKRLKNSPNEKIRNLSSLIFRSSNSKYNGPK